MKLVENIYRRPIVSLNINIQLLGSIPMKNPPCSCPLTLQNLKYLIIKSPYSCISEGLLHNHIRAKSCSVSVYILSIYSDRINSFSLTLLAMVPNLIGCWSGSSQLGGCWGTLFSSCVVWESLSKSIRWRGAWGFVTKLSIPLSKSLFST